MGIEEAFSVLSSETIEDLGRGGFRLLQYKVGFRFGVDTVLLAHFVASYMKRKSGQCCLELGAGNGAGSILLAARRPDIYIDGVELDDSAFRLFERNIALNGLGGRISAFHEDIRKWTPLSRRGKKYDCVFFNPPYFLPGSGLVPEKDGSSSLKNARFAFHGDIDAFLQVAASAVAYGGLVFFVHRPMRLGDCLAAMERCGLQAVFLRWVHPMLHKEASLFLLCARKGGKPGGLKVAAPLILWDEDDKMSAEVRDIYTEDGENVCCM